nr:ribonuclease H-like domain-containing protein [Tanacetum cinerariifolium]
MISLRICTQYVLSNRKEEYETWAMKMEYWIMYTDHNLWKIIQNGNSKKSLGRDSKGGIIILPPVSFEEHVAVQRETKARTLLLQSLPKDHMADFHHLDDAREIWLAVKARFGENEESKNMRKTMLKQEFSKFSMSEEEGLHKGYDWFQKILSQLNQMQAKPDNDDVNMKFLRALPPSWSQVALTLKTRGGLKYLSFDDLYNKLRFLEIDVKGGSSYGSRGGSNGDGIIGHQMADGYALTKDQQAKIENKEWEVKLTESLARFDKWKESSKNLANLINSSMSTRTKIGLGFKEYIGSNEVFDLFTPSVFDPEPKNREVKSLYERFVKAGEMHEVPPSITGTFMPTSYKSDLEETPVTFGSKSNTSSIDTSESNDFVSCDNSDKSSESETYDFASCVSSPKTNDSFSTVDVMILPKSNVKDLSPTNGFSSCSFKENVKPPRNLCNKSGIADRIHSKNNFVCTKTCFVCGSKSHLIKDCDVYDNVANFSSVISKAASVPAGSRKSSTSISAGRSIPAASRNRPASTHASRHIPAGRFNKPAPFLACGFVPTGWTNHAARLFFRPTNLYFDNVSWPGIYDHISMNEGRWGSAVHPHVNKGIGIIDSGCSRSMAVNKEKLDDFVQVKGCTVTFGGGDGKITGKCTIRTSKLNFKNVYYVEELQHFNLFSVSQIYDKKNKVLFTDDECLVLTKEFQLPDEGQDFIALIENQLNKKVKAIRSDNGTEFQNAKLIDLCGKKRIKRDYSNARTPQQNGVAERNNRNLIEATRSMLADSKLPTMFWTEAVSTACYVLNRVSITNPHNKTPYELLSEKVPNISHLKPFGCQVTILNTSDHLDKFKGKANEGFLVGYAANSKAYRVYNLSSKKVEETLNLRYLEDKPNVQGLGQEWYFDLDYLTDSLCYTRFKLIHLVI